jgi:homoserine O-succinyltransferase
VPIKIPDQLPARTILEAEGVTVMGEADAVRQDIRPLRIGLLNLMPNKIGTETQLARLLAATPLQIELTLVRITDHVTRNTSADHMAAFYRPWDDVRGERFDGFIITGAPVERLPYGDVRYWPELCAILDWTQTHVHRCLTICWAAQAALFHFHGVPKRELPRKAFGLFPHRNLAPTSPYLRGFSDRFDVPVSRWSEICPDRLAATDGLQILADNADTGACLVADPAHRTLHMFNHLEYETDTLALEYRRDGGSQLPEGYFPADDPMRAPENRWRSHAHLFFGNWINEIYQTAPFDIVGRTPLPVTPDSIGIPLLSVQDQGQPCLG